MDTLIKFFPFMPEPKDGGKLAIALVFYLLALPIIGMIVGAIMGLTIILLPLAPVVGAFCGIYGTVGMVLAIVRFCGK